MDTIISCHQFFELPGGGGIYVEYPSDDDTSYFKHNDDGENWIEIQDGHEGNEYIISHEYGHALMYRIYDGTDYPGSSGEVHIRYSEYDTDHAICEGWAEFFGDLMTNSQRSENDFKGYYEYHRGKELGKDPELDGDSWQKPDTIQGIEEDDWDGHRVEGSVAKILNDLYDDTPNEGLNGLQLAGDEWSEYEQNLAEDKINLNSFYDLTTILENHRPQSVMKIYQKLLSENKVEEHHLRSLFYNNGIRDFDDDGDVDESAPTIDSMSPIGGTMGGLIQLEASASDPDSPDANFLGVRFYYMDKSDKPEGTSTHEWLENSRNQWNGIDSDVTGDDGFNTMWHSTDAFSSADGGSDDVVCIIAEVNDSMKTDWGYEEITIDNDNPLYIEDSSHEVKKWSNNNDPDFSLNNPPDIDETVGYKMVFNHKSGTIPDDVTSDTTSSTTIQYENQADGDDYYFHAQYLDDQGNWEPSDGIHYGPIKIDTDKPTIDLNGITTYPSSGWYTDYPGHVLDVDFRRGDGQSPLQKARYRINDGDWHTIFYSPRNSYTSGWFVNWRELSDSAHNRIDLELYDTAGNVGVGDPYSCAFEIKKDANPPWINRRSKTIYGWYNNDPGDEIGTYFYSVSGSKMDWARYKVEGKSWHYIFTGDRYQYDNL